MQYLSERLVALGFVPNVDYELTDRGEGPYISAWFSAQPQPSQAVLAATEPGPALTRLSKQTLILRLTSAEASLLAAAQSEADDKMRMIWDAVNNIDHNDPLFPTLRGFILGVIGDAARTDELLAPEF